MSKGKFIDVMVVSHLVIHLDNSSSEPPSKFLHDIAPGITPVITSHGDVNFFEKSFEKAMASPDEQPNTKLPSLKGLPALNSKLKLNSIQLISPPSDPGSQSGQDYKLSYHQPPAAPQQSVQMGPFPGAPLTSTFMTHQPGMMTFPMVPVMSGAPMMAKAGVETANRVTGADPNWAASIQQAKASSLEKQMRFQEKNRIAAMKSRQRKKKEWERLQESEKTLLEENRSLKERIAILEGEIRVLREAAHVRRQD